MPSSPHYTSNVWLHDASPCSYWRRYDAPSHVFTTHRADMASQTKYWKLAEIKGLARALISTFQLIFFFLRWNMPDLFAVLNVAHIVKSKQMFSYFALIVTICVCFLIIVSWSLLTTVQNLHVWQHKTFLCPLYKSIDILFWIWNINTTRLYNYNINLLEAQLHCRTNMESRVALH